MRARFDRSRATARSLTKLCGALLEKKTSVLSRALSFSPLGSLLSLRPVILDFLSLALAGLFFESRLGGGSQILVTGWGGQSLVFKLAGKLRKVCD